MNWPVHGRTTGNSVNLAGLIRMLGVESSISYIIITDARASARWSYPPFARS